MPRSGRLDIAGQLYHVVARGIECRNVFRDNKDCENFITRLRGNLEKTGNKCLAWCLIPNHFHLLILRGQRPLAELMRRLLTGYAVSFNLRHRRAGHLFQNRYKAILCEEETYLQDLVAYIHLNPIRAGLVDGLPALAKYTWCGHGALMGKANKDFLEMGYVLEHFGGSRGKYEALVKDRLDKYEQGQYSAGGLIKSMGGLARVLGLGKEREVYDERVLGCGDFVEDMLRKVDENVRVVKTSEDVLTEAAAAAGLSREELLRPSHKHKASQGRALYCYLAKKYAGVNGAELSRQLGITSGGISRLVEKGWKQLCMRGTKEVS